MKVNKIKNRNYKLFKYNLLKLQIYSNKSVPVSDRFSDSILEQIEAYLKQVLKIIFEYHVYQFKVLFVGFPVISNTNQMKLIDFTNHNFISKKSWVSGIFRNRLSILTYLKLAHSQNLSKSFKILLEIKTKPHLVVIFDQKVEDSMIHEFYKAGIPVLSFDWKFSNTFKIAYKAFGNFKFVERNIKLTFFLLLYSLLKKTTLKQRRGLPEKCLKKKYTKNKYFRKKDKLVKELEKLLNEPFKKLN